jgi:hypothetical protein
VSKLVEHAVRELELCGQTAESPAYAQSLIAAIAAFASYGHSGGSAMVAIEQLHTLLRWRTLSPLTSDPDEWEDRSGISNSPMWQNRRDSAAFSRDGGQTWYFVDDRNPEHPSHHPDPASPRAGSPVPAADRPATPPGQDTTTE